MEADDCSAAGADDDCDGVPDAVAQLLRFGHGELAVAEPKKLRHRVWHAAATIARTGRQTIVRFQQSWPWTTDIVIAFQRLRVALPG